MTAGLIIFAATYVLIAVQRLPFVHLNRPAASLLGAVAMVVSGVLSLPQAYGAVDFDVLVFLLGLMLVVGYLEGGCFFEWAAEWLLRRARTPDRLLLGVVVGGGLLSAFFVNDTICLMVTPVLLAALGPLRVRPTPYLIGLAVVAWLAGGSLPLVAITVGALMVAIAQRDPAYAIDRIEWGLLLFFASLFVVMRGLEQTGAVAWIDAHAVALAQGSSAWGGAAAVSGVMLVLSNLISNVPAVLLWRNTVPTLSNPDLTWRIVAMSSTFAGNLLLIGSMANLIVAERAEARGVRIGFVEYARVGVPVTLLTLAWGIVVLAVTR